MKKRNGADAIFLPLWCRFGAAVMFTAIRGRSANHKSLSSLYATARRGICHRSIREPFLRPGTAQQRIQGRAVN